MTTEPAVNDSIITLSFDLTEETVRSATMMVADGVNGAAERADEGSSQGPQPNQSELDEARSVAEEARRRESAEQERQRQQERGRD